MCKLIKRYRKIRAANIDDPFTVLLSKLTGLTRPPKACQAYQQWMSENYHDGEHLVDAVNAAWMNKCEEEGISGKRLTANFRAAMARCTFAKLSREVQAEWESKAKASAAQMKADYEQALKAAPSKDPVDRQQ